MSLCRMLAPLAAALAAAACSSQPEKPGPRLPTTNAQAIERADASTPEPRSEPECVMQEVVVERYVPDVWLVVDGSGSMLEALSSADTTSRWSALRDALLDPEEGVIKQTERHIHWGLLAYDGPLTGAEPMTASGPTLECPRLVEVAPASESFEALDAAFTSEPLGGSTPTDKALGAVVERIAEREEPAGVILITDGQPNDFCSDTPVDDVEERVVAQVKSLTAAGHNVYIVSLAADDAALQQHLSDVARVSGTGAEVFSPRSSAEIKDTINEIVGAPFTCELVLSGSIKQGDTCLVEVQLNGEELECEADDGWRLKDPQTIELTGKACERFKSDLEAELSAQLPCEILD